MTGNILFRVLVWEVQEVINKNVIEFNCASTCHGNASGNYFYQNFLSKPGYMATKNKGEEGDEEQLKFESDYYYFYLHNCCVMDTFIMTNVQW